MNEITDLHIAKAIATLHADEAPILADVVEAVISFVRSSGADEATLEFRFRMIDLQRAMNDRDRREILNDD